MIITTKFAKTALLTHTCKLLQINAKTALQTVLAVTSLHLLVLYLALAVFQATSMTKTNRTANLTVTLAITTTTIS